MFKIFGQTFVIVSDSDSVLIDLVNVPIIDSITLLWAQSLMQLESSTNVNTF